jgi:hypothetical protein
LVGRIAGKEKREREEVEVEVENVERSKRGIVNAGD